MNVSTVRSNRGAAYFPTEWISFVGISKEPFAKDFILPKETIFLYEPKKKKNNEKRSFNRQILHSDTF